MTASRRSDHTDATRRALVDAGRYLFARRDYGDVSIEDIVTRARVTRGALDYHFDSKKDLFQTVLEVVEADLVADVEAAIAKVTDAWICWSSASTPSLTRRPNRMRCRSLRLTARQCSGGANGAGSTCARAWSAGRGSRTRDGRRGDSARTVATTFASAAGRANRIRAADRGRDGPESRSNAHLWPYSKVYGCSTPAIRYGNGPPAAIAASVAKCSPSSDAPPTRPPSTSSWATMSPTFLAFTEPP